MAVSKMPGWTGSAPNRPIPIRNISQLCSPFVTLFLRNMYTHMYVYVYLYILYLKLKHCIHKKTIWVFKKRKITQAHQKKNCDGDISVVSPGMSLEGWRRQCVRIAESASRKRLGCVLTMRPKNGVGVGGKPRVYCRDFSRVSNIKLFGFYNLHIVDGRNPKEPPFGWCWNPINNWDNHHPWCRISSINSIFSVGFVDLISDPYMNTPKCKLELKTNWESRNKLHHGRREGEGWDLRKMLAG